MRKEVGRLGSACGCSSWWTRQKIREELRVLDWAIR